MNKLKIFIIVLLCFTARIVVAQTDTMQIFNKKVDSVYFEMRKSKGSFEDESYYYFTGKNNFKIKNKLINAKSDFNIDTSTFFNKSELFQYLSYYIGIENTKKKFDFILQNGNKISLKERNDILADRGYPQAKFDKDFIDLQVSYIKSGEVFNISDLRKKIDTIQTYKSTVAPIGIRDSRKYHCEKIDTIPSIVATLFPNVEFYNCVTDYGLYAVKGTTILYNDFIYSYMDFNELYFLENPNENHSLEEKIICLIYFLENITEPIEIISINDISRTITYNERNYSFNIEINAMIGDVSVTYYVCYEYEQFNSFCRYTENNVPFIYNILKF